MPALTWPGGRRLGGGGEGLPGPGAPVCTPRHRGPCSRTRDRSSGLRSAATRGHCCTVLLGGRGRKGDGHQPLSLYMWPVCSQLYSVREYCSQAESVKWVALLTLLYNLGLPFPGPCAALWVSDCVQAPSRQPPRGLAWTCWVPPAGASRVCSPSAGGWRVGRVTPAGLHVSFQDRSWPSEGTWTPSFCERLNREGTSSMPSGPEPLGPAPPRPPSEGPASFNNEGLGTPSLGGGGGRVWYGTQLLPCLLLPQCPHL